MKGPVLVTGSAKRIGRAIALALAAEGFDIIVHYNASQADGLKTAEDIEALGRKAWLAELDLANLAAVERLIPTLAAELGPIAALVNSASVFLSDSETDDLDAHRNINAEAPRILNEAFQKQAPNGGAIVNILDADPSAPDFSLYNASKIALHKTTIEMAKHFAPKIRVNGLALGPVLRNPRQTAKHFQKLIERTPLKKASTPENVASAVRFLIETPSLTGTIIPVDSGLHLTKSE